MWRIIKWLNDDIYPPLTGEWECDGGGVEFAVKERFWGDFFGEGTAAGQPVKVRGMNARPDILLNIVVPDGALVIFRGERIDEDTIYGAYKPADDPGATRGLRALLERSGSVTFVRKRRAV